MLACFDPFKLSTYARPGCQNDMHSAFAPEPIKSGNRRKKEYNGVCRPLGSVVMELWR
jgi:hypothetical protein